MEAMRRLGRWMALMIVMCGTGSATAAAAMPAGSAAASATATPPPFVPITYQRLAVPSTVQPWGLTWFPDGRHILFENEVDYSLWTVGADGHGAHCLTCGMQDFPAVSDNSGEFSYVFGDAKRIFVGYDEATIPQDPPRGADAWVIECHPSVLDCASHQVLPIDLSADEAGPQPVLMRRTFHLAPDGVHLGWMDVRPDGTLLLVAALQRGSSDYVATDVRVINPAGPTSPADTDPAHWETAGQIFELKSFANGGRDAIIVGQPNAINPDQELVNLATGAVTRLTSGPDWDEDGAISPDGRWLTDASFRTMHGTDVLGLLWMLPDFIDLPTAAGAAGYYVSSHAGFQCDLTPWLLPATGDDGGRLLGQPLGPYARGGAYVANNFFGQQTWSPDGSKVLLDERRYGPPTGGRQVAYMGGAPHEVLVANLGVKPGPPLPVVPSTVGAWAATPLTFNSGFATPGVVTVNGPASGSATLSYAGNLLDGEESVSYHHYSSDGRTFVDGTESVNNPAFLATNQTWTAAIVISGAHTGYLTADMNWHSKTVINAALDGYQLNGLPKVGACPSRMPHPARLALGLTTRRSGRLVRIRVLVTSSIAGAGLTEQGLDTRPVQGAVVRAGGRQAITDAAGVAVLRLPAARPSGRRSRRVLVRATAGDTFLPATSAYAL